MATNDIKYFNFPVQLLTDFMINSNKALNDICDYAIYAHSLKLSEGSQIDRIKSSAKYFNVSLGNHKHTNENGRLLHNSLPDNSPMVGLNLNVFWDYYKSEKTEFEKICLLGFLALKSIVQKKPFCKVTNSYFLSRIAGTAKAVEVIALPESIRKYAIDYQIRKIKTELRNNWGLVTYARYTRGFYVSFSMNLETLVFQAEKKRKATKEKQYRKQQSEALKSALQKLNVV